MLTNKYVVWGLVIASVIMFLIYRKKIFKSIPSIDELKNKILKGEGMASAVKIPAHSFQANTDGAIIGDMMKSALSKYTVRDLEAATKDWNSVDATPDPAMFDSSKNLVSKPPTVQSIMPKHTASEKSITEPVDMGQLIRNQVVINDLWGPPGCKCGGSCRSCSGRTLTFRSN